MNRAKVPHKDHISRLCPPKSITEEGEIEASAFFLRDNEEGLSVNWLECLGCGSREEEIDAIRDLYSKKFSRVSVKAKITVLNVGAVHHKVLMESLDTRNLEFLHEPEDSPVLDPSHCAIYNLRPDNIMIAELILQLVSETYLAPKQC